MMKKTTKRNCVDKVNARTCRERGKRSKVAALEMILVVYSVIEKEIRLERRRLLKRCNEEGGEFDVGETEWLSRSKAIIHLMMPSTACHQDTTQHTSIQVGRTTKSQLNGNSESNQFANRFSDKSTGNKQNIKC
jgi:hypothetical protein